MRYNETTVTVGNELNYDFIQILATVYQLTLLTVQPRLY